MRSGYHDDTFETVHYYPIWCDDRLLYSYKQFNRSLNEQS
ncbi:hypothetical protein PSSM7_065 [Prochlorococcus phage P-SSM7]|uniref:Uncharacterized protein n=1 Tax=Prochlorococcus phage P-SSM7 TaxID=445688 RepID=E3SNI3_9CAUD|nr:hypothetical protein PSSM7_065 [Prochlorococcus phage P-SSM7]ADO99038.1 hypothetical protein PSSM7_065 [Prochlorococcus phage P-SSM7]